MTPATLDYLDGDTRCSGVLFRPSHGRPAPGIVVAHEAWGITPNALQRGGQLAEHGYLALVADIFGERHKPADGPAAMALIARWRADPVAFRARMGAAVEALKATGGCDGRIGAIGFCFGGGAVLELARSGRPDVAGVVSFHGALGTQAPAERGQVPARLLVLHGADDPLVPDDELLGFLREMRAAQADCTTVAYTGAVHGFTNESADGAANPAVRYHARTFGRAWAMMRGFLADLFT